MQNQLRKIPSGVRLLPLLLLLGMLQVLSAKVPAHPLYKNPPVFSKARPSEQFGPYVQGKDRTLPQNILVLRAQFTDVTFRSAAAYPDSLAHDKAFFERWMLHLADFYAAASHGAYNISYTVPDQVFNLSNTMAYYGADTSEENDIRVPQMLQELIQMADPFIDYSEYDAIIVFHAGAGQESDIGLLPNLQPMRPGTIWSTFMTRRELQAAFDPDNDNYQGIPTNDGTYIRELVLVPESEYQDYFPPPPHPDAYVYIFSLYGVLAHQFGHQIGLPTLFDNYSANGVSQGIGNWGLMGTGLWNGNGNVPAQLSAWSRYYLGWEQAQTIVNDTENLTVDYFLDNSPTAQRLYKIPISAKEYFLVENRQQNPDGSLDPYNNQPSFTFTLLDANEQDYYPAPNELLPFFNFMENRYKGCEWDFFLPGLGGPSSGGPLIDGSGLMIWHIDENIIESNFDPGFEYNYVNYDASHKGVDVEEADGVQHLDTAVYNLYKYGGPFDTFRQGNNDYFGHGTISVFDPNTQENVIVMHLPTAASYYGGVPLEIYDISDSGNQMTFSVSFGWKLSTGYEGINTLDACSVDADYDGENEIFYPMPDGNLFMWKDEELATDFPINGPGDVKSYLWDGEAFYLAFDLTNDLDIPILRLSKLYNGQLTTLFTKPNGAKWAAPIMAFDDYIVAPMHAGFNNDFQGWSVSLHDKINIAESTDIWGTATDSLVANLAYFREKIFAITKSVTDGTYKLNVMTPGVSDLLSYPLSIPADSVIIALSIAPVLPQFQGDLLIQTPYSIYINDLTGQTRSGYPIVLPFYSNSQVTISDTDRNGTLDYLVSGENSFAVYDYAGKNMLTNFTGLSTTDSLYITSGVLAGDLDGDNKTEFIGAFSRNRLVAFEENLRFFSGFPVSFTDRSRNMPFIHQASDSLVYAWLPTDNGKIFRAELPESALGKIDSGWYSRYANLQRTSSRELGETQNQYATDKLFVPGETYIFPNPVRTIYEQKLTFQIMTNRDANVEVSIFDIAGKKLYRKNVICKAYLKNREAVDFPVKNLSSGVYIAVLKSGETIKRIKFAVEK